MKIMKKLISISMLLALVGCTPEYADQSNIFSNLPPELKDCKIFRISGSNGGSLYVTKCPQFISTSDSGKHPEHNTLVHENPTPVKQIPNTVIVDGVEYKR